MAMATQQPALHVEDILDRVEELEPLIRKHAGEAERERKLSSPVAEALKQAGLFHLFRPRALGGLQLDPVSADRVIEELSRIDSAAGWNVSLANACEPFGAWCSCEVADEIFGSPDTVMAGSFFPPRTARPVEGGYRLSGRTPFNSNCHASTWLIGLANVEEDGELRLDETGAPIMLLTFIPTRETTIVENWNTLGMRGTGSHDVEVNDLFIPERHAVPFLPLEQPSGAYEWPLSRMATAAGVPLNAVPALGIARAAIDDLLELGKKVPAYTAKSLRDRSVVQMRLAQAEAELSAARALLFEEQGKAWEIASRGEILPMPQRARCLMAASHVVISCARAIQLVHSCVGASGIREEKKFQRYFRDVHVITQHAYVCETRLEAVGQVMLGMEPDWSFLQFP